VPDQTATAARSYLYVPGDQPARLQRAAERGDTVGEDYRDQGLGARRPSRLHAIEELPVALGMLVVSGSDFRQAVLGGVNYGRDADSIAGPSLGPVTASLAPATGQAVDQ
jgi:ADP-ribosylglycohydrolase